MLKQLLADTFAPRKQKYTGFRAVTNAIMTVKASVERVCRLVNQELFEIVGKVKIIAYQIIEIKQRTRLLESRLEDVEEELSSVKIQLKNEKEWRVFYEVERLREKAETNQRFEKLERVCKKKNSISTQA